MQENRLIDLETKIAHQEQVLDELNSALVDQQEQISALRKLCASLAEQLRHQPDELSGLTGEEPPPHY